MRKATFCDVLPRKQNKSRKQTLESAQSGLEIIFKWYKTELSTFVPYHEKKS